VTVQILYLVSGTYSANVVSRASFIKRQIKSCEREIDDLYNIFRSYISDMTSIIRPVSYDKMMRVSRNDIYWNMKEIFGSVDKIKRLKNKSLFGNVTNPFNDDEQKKNEEENAQKLKQAVKDIEKYYNRLETGKKSMERIFNNKIVVYEDMDDTYKSKANNLYNRYSSSGEQIKDFFGNLGSGIKDFAGGFLKGFASTIFSFICQILSTAVEIEVLPIGLFGLGCNLVFGDSPNFLKPYEDRVISDFDKGVEFVKYVKNVINDPTILVDNLGQSVNDTYEEKGLAYITGNLTGDIAGMYALGKLGKIDDKFAKLANKGNSMLKETQFGQRFKYLEKLKEGVIDDIAWERLWEYTKREKINLNDLLWEEKKPMLDQFKVDIRSSKKNMNYAYNQATELLNISDKRLSECMKNGYNSKTYYKILNTSKDLRTSQEYLESLSNTKLIENWHNAFYGNDSTTVISYMSKDNYSNFVLGQGKIGRDGVKGGQFVLPQKLAEDIESKLSKLGTVTSPTDEFKIQLAKELAVPDNQFESGVVRVKIPLKSDIDLHMPAGIEEGCNYQWIPGGKTLGGNFEGIIKQITEDNDPELYNQIIKNAKGIDKKVEFTKIN